MLPTRPPENSYDISHAAYVDYCLEYDDPFTACQVTRHIASPELRQECIEKVNYAFSIYYAHAVAYHLENHQPPQAEFFLQYIYDRRLKDTWTREVAFAYDQSHAQHIERYMTQNAPLRALDCARQIKDKRWREECLEQIMPACDRYYAEQAFYLSAQHKPLEAMQCIQKIQDIPMQKLCMDDIEADLRNYYKKDYQLDYKKQVDYWVQESSKDEGRYLKAYLEIAQEYAKRIDCETLKKECFQNIQAAFDRHNSRQDSLLVDSYLASNTPRDPEKDASRGRKEESRSDGINGIGRPINGIHEDNKKIR